MKLSMKVWLAFLLIAVVSAGTVWAKEKVIVITGVGEANVARVSTFESVFDGIKEGLRTRNIKPEFLFVELVAIDDSIKEAVGGSFVARAMVHKPDLVITLTDDTLKYVGSKIDDVPVVFTWIFSHPNTLGMPKENITGVVRGSHSGAILGLARKLTGAKTVTVLSKNNESMRGGKQFLEANADKLERMTGVRLNEVELVDTFSEWADKVKECRSDMIYILDTSRVDSNGPMDPEELVRWTVDNATVPVIAATRDDVKFGALLSIVSSDKDIGLTAAQIALKILGGTRPSDIPYASSTKGTLMINTDTARKYGIAIPRDVLSKAKTYP